MFTTSVASKKRVYAKDYIKFDRAKKTQKINWKNV